MNLRDFETEEKLFIRRALIAFGLVSFCFGILGINLWRLQVCQHQYYQTRSNANDIKMIPVAPPRGMIYDRHGIPLVQNVTQYDLKVTPYKISNLHQMLRNLAPLIHLSAQDIADF